MSVRGMLVKLSASAVVIAMCETILSVFLHPAPSRGVLTSVAVSAFGGATVGFVIRWRRSSHHHQSF